MAKYYWHQTTVLLYVSLLCCHGRIALFYVYGMQSGTTSVEKVDFISEHFKRLQICL